MSDRGRPSARLILGLMLLAAGCSGSSGGPADRIVLVVIDTLRADHVWPYEADANTPHLRALAERGQVFTNMWASYHQTSMSMAALFTGRTPSLETGKLEHSLAFTGENWCGLSRFRSPGDACVPPGLSTLATALRDAGYWTAAVSTNPILFRPGGYDRGFDVWREVGTTPVDTDDRLPFRIVRPRDHSAEVANRVAAELLAERESDRFFLYVHYMDVHDYALRRLRYEESVPIADRALGDLMASLESEELLGGTVVFALSDHGERLGEKHLVEGKPQHFGNPSFDEVLRVPLIVAPPRFEETDRFLRSEDVHRLILEVAGVEPPTLRDTADDELFLSEDAYQTYRSGRWKSFRRRGSDRIRLVDLIADPHEREDAAPRHPEVVDRHRTRMDALTRSLAASDAPPSELTPRDAARLRALGYLD